VTDKSAGAADDKRRPAGFDRGALAALALVCGTALMVCSIGAIVAIKIWG
jgi:hypothetical protein